MDKVVTLVDPVAGREMHHPWTEILVDRKGDADEYQLAGLVDLVLDEVALAYEWEEFGNLLGVTLECFSHGAVLHTGEVSRIAA